jgi:hypothetical protein
MYFKNILQEPNAKIRELLVGLQRGATTAQGLSEAQRRHNIGQSVDTNILSWIINQIQHSNTTHKTPNEPLTTTIGISATSDPELPPTNNPVITQIIPPPGNTYHGNPYTFPMSGSLTIKVNLE